MEQRFAKLRFGTVTTETGRNILLNICSNASSPKELMSTFKYFKMSQLADSCGRGEDLLSYGRKGYIPSYFGTVLCVLRKRGRETKAFNKGCVLVPTCKGHTLFCSLPASKSPTGEIEERRKSRFHNADCRLERLPL